MAEESKPDPWAPIKALVVLALSYAVQQRLKSCSGCGRENRPDNEDAVDWVVQTVPLVLMPIGVKCPNCQTPEERAECAIRQAGGVLYDFNGINLTELPIDPDEEDGHREAS